jgi:gas vesicle protein
LLLHFAYAQLCEVQKKGPEGRKTFDTLLEHLIEKINILEKEASDEIEELTKAAAEERANMDLGDDIDGELRERLRSREKEIEKEKSKIKTEKDSKVAVLARSCSQVWITYMQYARRSEVISTVVFA